MERWQEQKKKKRQRFRLWGAVIFLSFLVLIILANFLQKASWQEMINYLSKFAVNTIPDVNESPLAPIPQNDQTSQLINFLSLRNIEISSSPTGSGSALLVPLREGTLVVFSSHKDLQKQVSSLQIILSRLTIEGKKAKIIDFRYDDPILTY